MIRWLKAREGTESTLRNNLVSPTNDAAEPAPPPRYGLAHPYLSPRMLARSPVKDTPKPKRPGATIGSLHPQLPVQQSYDPHLQRRKPYEYATELSTLSQCGPQEPEILSSSHYTHGEASAGWREVQSRGANIATLTDMVLVLGRVQRFLSSAIEPKYRT